MSENWTYQQTLKLIEHYKANEALWDLQHEHHSNKHVRHRLITGIAKQLNMEKLEIDGKLKNLRNQFWRARKEIKHAIMYGKKKRSVWVYYKKLKFLLRNTKEEGNNDDALLEPDVVPAYIPLTDDEIDSEQSDSKIVDVKSLKRRTSEQPLIEAKKRAKLDAVQTQTPNETCFEEEINQSQAEETVQSNSTANTISDEYKIFAQYVASELRKVKNEYALMIAKNKINNVLFNAQIGKYNMSMKNEQDSGEEIYFTSD